MKTFWYILLCELVGVAGGFATRSNIEGWYRTLRRPSFAPPNRVFGPVWTILYALMGIAAARVVHDPTCAALFWLQLGLNGVWSFVFFAFHRMGLALLNIVALWVSIALCVHAFGQVDPVAARLFWPYWAWVSFATVLNFEFWRLNPAKAVEN